MRLRAALEDSAPMVIVALFISLTTSISANPAQGQDRLTVIAVSPHRHSLATPVDTAIKVEFDRPLVDASVVPSSFWAFGRWSGVATGKLALDGSGSIVTLTPNRRFSAGETVMVILSRDL